MLAMFMQHSRPHFYVEVGPTHRFKFAPLLSHLKRTLTLSLILKPKSLRHSHFSFFLFFIFLAFRPTYENLSRFPLPPLASFLSDSLDEKRERARARAQCVLKSQALT